ncbi:translational GTPase TypA, partial [bacterium]|nr:translational GTPase TypA [bacterium]
QEVCVTRDGKSFKKARITKIYNFKINKMEEIDSAGVGNIIALSGIEDVTMGETITDPKNPIVLPYIEVDPPTISMNFLPNDSPFSGKDGKFVTSNHLKERLFREVLSDAALKVEVLTDEVGFKVSGRGELHLAVLIEKMRREGYELQVTKPKVIFKEEKGVRLEPYEELSIEAGEEHMGKVMEMLGERKGQMINMRKENAMIYLEYKIPTRGLLGFRSEFMTQTKGMGLMNYMFMEYDKFSGEITHRINGVLISSELGETVGFALFNIQERGTLFVEPGQKVYVGQILGEHSRDNDLNVNPSKGKKLTNMRASGSDDSIILKPVKRMSLENCLNFIAEDELVEVTPKDIRIRKKILDETGRKRQERGRG